MLFGNCGRNVWHVVFVVGLMAMGRGVWADLDDGDIIEKDFNVSCTNSSTGQLCDTHYYIPIEINVPSYFKAKYIVPTGHCSPVKIHFFVDGKSVNTSNFLGWNGATNEFKELDLETTFLDLGYLPSGSHIVSIQAEGQTGGCNNSGRVNSWGGTLILKSSFCQLYGVHDEGLNNSQFLTISPETFEVKALGKMKKAHDIEALDIHPQTGELFAASGNDTNIKGHLYQLNSNTGELTSIGSTGFKEIDGLSFHPDGTLWGWATGAGLVTIDIATGKASLVTAYSGEVEDLTWNTAGTMLFGVENIRNNPDSGVKLLAYDGSTLTTVCAELTQSLEIEALDALPDDTLIFGLHGKNSLPIGVIDVNTCQITASTEIATGYDDVEGIAWPMKGCNSTPSTCSGVEVTGVLTNEGVECQALRSNSGQLYTLSSNNLNGFKIGDSVKVCGKKAEISFCMQGSTISVDTIVPYTP